MTLFTAVVVAGSMMKQKVSGDHAEGTSYTSLSVSGRPDTTLLSSMEVDFTTSFCDFGHCKGLVHCQKLCMLGLR